MNSLTRNLGPSGLKFRTRTVNNSETETDSREWRITEQRINLYSYKNYVQSIPKTLLTYSITYSCKLRHDRILYTFCCRTFYFYHLKHFIKINFTSPSSNQNPTTLFWNTWTILNSTRCTIYTYIQKLYPQNHTTDPTRTWRSEFTRRTESKYNGP